MRPALPLALLGTFGIALPAHAGGTTTGSSESSSTDSTGTDSTGTDSTGTDSTGTDSTSETTSTTDDTGTTSDTTGGVVDDTTGSTCSCATGDESIAIDTPADSANVDAPFLVTVDVVPRCPCFDCSCAAEDFEYAQLFLDAAAWGGPCYASPCEWEVTATLGSHEIRATAQYPGGEASTSIEVFVVSVDQGTTTDIPPDPTTAPPGSDTSTGFAGETAPSGGCGCVSAPRAQSWLGALVVLVLRRRRRT